MFDINVNNYVQSNLLASVERIPENVKLNDFILRYLQDFVVENADIYRKKVPHKPNPRYRFKCEQHCPLYKAAQYLTVIYRQQKVEFSAMEPWKLWGYSLSTCPRVCQSNSLSAGQQPAAQIKTETCSQTLSLSGGALHV